MLAVSATYEDGVFTEKRLM